jgi:ADP-dependent NAD(P)H-hydrate dehydratase / NAD(P)H-hydrate epimerase
MQIFSAEQIRQWDAYTIEHEPVTSLNLMERAATQCFQWLQQHFSKTESYAVFCGSGNNGGDGLVIARKLLEARQTVMVYLLAGNHPSTDFTENLRRLQTLDVQLTTLENSHQFPAVPGGAIVLDALFGSGLNRPLEGLAAELVQHLNRHTGTTVAIDVPSGLFIDKPSGGNTAVQASHTLTFQAPKLAFLMAENEIFTGKWEVLDISLHAGFVHENTSAYEYLETAQITSIIHPLKKNTYKNKLGHALLYAGSKGMMGAAVMSAHACLRSGVGLLTTAIPEAGLDIMQGANPQAMCFTEEKWLATEGWKKFQSIGIGPGWGATDECRAVTGALAAEWKGPLVVDASGLEQFSFEIEAANRIPQQAIITPHPGEFDRLFGKHENSFERAQKAIDKAVALNIYIVLKGAYTLIATPQGKGHYNSTGNPGMAKGGAGDVLTGVLTALLAQGYTPLQAALLGVYLHGLAGDNAAANKSYYGMNAMDIAEALPQAWKQLQ